jgi:hypothetical protein
MIENPESEATRQEAWARMRRSATVAWVALAMCAWEGTRSRWVGVEGIVT